ncbi:DMT family transporter [Peribacillus kribbensis]|uniref:DMT family transporter n=1 Tax=Peribacillus kribbensis TaxID=356658 RepID=UPI0003FD91D4|nr:DMT family transporter [Peribacillus kribbensis]
MKKSLYADAGLLMVALIWGVSFVLVQNAIAHLEPYSFNAIRFLLAALILAVWHLLKNPSRSGFRPGLLKAGMKMGLWLFLGYALQTIGLLHTTPAKAGFITGLSIVIVPLLSLLFLKQALTLQTAFGIIAATAGLYLMTMIGESRFTVSDLLILIAAFSFAMHVVMTGKYSQKFEALPLTIVQLTVVSLLSFAGGFVFENPAGSFSLHTLFLPDVAAGLLITSLLATAAAFLIQTSLQRFTSPARVALAFSTEPVFAAITSYFWIGETLSPYAMAGCVLIFGGIILSEIPVKKQPLTLEK